MNSKYLSKAFKVMAVIFIAGIPLTAAGAPNPPNTPPSGYSDPGVQLNRNREHLEYEQNTRKIQEEWKQQQNKVEKEKEAQPKEETEKIQFLLQKVIVDDSEVLSNEEINTITKESV